MLPLLILSVRGRDQERTNFETDEGRIAQCIKKNSAMYKI